MLGAGKTSLASRDDLSKKEKRRCSWELCTKRGCGPLGLVSNVDTASATTGLICVQRPWEYTKKKSFNVCMYEESYPKS